jgi:hypothetical protein
MLEEGNATMGIWLGKQFLGQRDEIRHQVENSVLISVALPRLTDPAPPPEIEVAPRLLEPPIKAGPVEVEEPELRSSNAAGLCSR